MGEWTKHDNNFTSSYEIGLGVLCCEKVGTWWSRFLVSIRVAKNMGNSLTDPRESFTTIQSFVKPVPLVAEMVSSSVASAKISATRLERVHWLTDAIKNGSRPGWPDWANFHLLGDCLLWAVTMKIRKVFKNLGNFFHRKCCALSLTKMDWATF
jgi:hypothetical protein